MESEISSMRAMMAQLLQNVMGTKPKQHRDEPRGVTEATVAATSKTATATPIPKQTAVKEHQQPATQEVEAMDTCEDQTKQLTTEPTPPSQPPKPCQTPRQHRSQERENRTPSLTVVLLQESLVTDATTVRLGRCYQVFYQLYRQGGSRGLVTLVRKDIPAALTEHPHDLGEQVDTLCVTLHLGRTYKLNIYNVYC
ncbi:hypothetical protein E2C01_102774 [Portunus trituberculatus]|uniref:Uncharacterized protein n=1 Tax=Portunus trituberculatus TaxID=210409 RepID=A0A5B7KJB9_PORTR|nr:hypothetical protein [Portunus trituberculatus]